MPFVIGDDDTLHHPEFQEAGTALASLILAHRKSTRFGSERALTTAPMS